MITIEDFKKIDPWKEGEYLDLWSVNHLFSGIVFTGWMLIVTSNTWIILTLFVILTLGWEILEEKLGLHEHLSNKIMDVVVGMLGLLLVFALVNLGKPLSTNHLIIASAIYLTLIIDGHIIHKKNRVTDDNIRES